MYNAAFFDVDGTLQSFATKTVPASAIEALHLLRDKGVKVFVATGRHKSELANIRVLFEFDAYITLNGQYCFDRDGVYHHLAMDKDDVAVAVEQAKQNLYPCYFVTAEEKFINYIDDEVIEVCRLVGARAPEIRPPEAALNQTTYQLCAYLRKDRERFLLDKLKHADIARWHPTFMDVVPEGGSKQAGIDATMAHFGLSNDSVIAFGDGENDVSMIANAKTGVAVANAGPEAKAVADYITDDVDNDGILKAVLKFFG